MRDHKLLVFTPMRGSVFCKELKDPEFWSEFSDGAETALKGQYVFIKTTLLTVAALSPVSEVCW